MIKKIFGFPKKTTNDIDVLI